MYQLFIAAEFSFLFSSNKASTGVFDYIFNLKQKQYHHLPGDQFSDLDSQNLALVHRAVFVCRAVGLCIPHPYSGSVLMLDCLFKGAQIVQLQ